MNRAEGGMSSRPFVGGCVVRQTTSPGPSGGDSVTQVGDIVSAGRREPLVASTDVNSSWWAPWQVIALVVVTVANYVWQVPYYLHFYGRFGITPGGLTVPLLLTFLWFLVATVLLVTRRRGGVPAMASFLVVEALFYLVHNVSGAAGRDLRAGDAVLLVASLLGYLNGFASVLFLAWLLLLRRRTSSGDWRPTRSH